jgi:hypothetical protein
MNDEHPGHEPLGPEHPGAPGADHPSEEELRARLEEELRRITVRDVLLQTVVSLINLAGQRLGLGEGGGDMRDLDQVRLAIEGVRALLPLVEEENPEQMKPVRDALSQLQMVYAREAGGGAEPGGGEPGGGAGPDGGAGSGGGAGRPPRQQPGRGQPGGLWVPPGSAT